MIRHLLIAILAVSAFSTDALAWYNASTGTFVQRDPAGYRDGMNLYRYGASNPGRYVDPTGLTSIPPQGPSWLPPGFDPPPGYNPDTWIERPNPNYDPNNPGKMRPGTLIDPDGFKWDPHQEDGGHNPHWDKKPQKKGPKTRVPIKPGQSPFKKPPAPGINIRPNQKPGKIGWLGTGSCIAKCAKDYDICLGTANNDYDRCINTAISIQCDDERESYGRLCGGIFVLDAGICATKYTACALGCLLPF